MQPKETELEKYDHSYNNCWNCNSPDYDINDKCSCCGVGLNVKKIIDDLLAEKKNTQQQTISDVLKIIKEATLIIDVDKYRDYLIERIKKLKERL